MGFLLYSIKVGKFTERHFNRLVAIIATLALVAGFSNFIPPEINNVPKAHATDADMILFWDSSTAVTPAGWTCISDGAGENFLNRYVRAASTYGSSAGGAATHTHTTTAQVMPDNTSTQASTGVPSPNATVNTHNHAAAANTTVSSDNNLPLYRSLMVIKYSGIPATIPRYAIGMFTATADVPANWTLYTSIDGRLLRGEASTQDAGNNNPTHNVASGAAAALTAPVKVPTSVPLRPAADQHSHGAGLSVATNGPSIIPPHAEIIFAQANDNPTAIPTNLVVGFDDSSSKVIPAAWDVISDGDSSGYWQNKFLMGDSSTPGGADDGATTHSHTNPVTVTTGPPSATVNTGTGSSGPLIATGTHTHQVRVTLQDNVDHTPEYWDLVLAKKILVYTPTTNNWRWYADEEDVTPGTPYANENTQPPDVDQEMGKNVRLKLRININNTAGAAENNSRKKLQFTTDTLNWFDVAAIGATTTDWRYYDGGGNDNDTLPSALLTGSDAAILGIHNESSSDSPSNSDHPADTTVEFEYCIEAYNPSVHLVYTFRLYDQILAAAISPDTGKSNPNIRMVASFALSVSSPASVYFGSWVLGAGGKHSYTFVGGEEVTNRDNRGLAGGGNSNGWTCSVEVTTPLSSGGDQITGADMYWISYTTDITPLFAAPTTGLGGNPGEGMSSAVTVITVSGSGYNGLGGFTILPTVEVRSAPAAGDYTGGVLTFTTI